MSSIQSILALATLAGAATAHAVEPVTYRCERLIGGKGNAHGINDRGEVVGTAHVPKDAWHGAVWRQQRAQALANAAGYEKDAAVALAINRQGNAAGNLNHDGLYKPVLWTQGVATVLPQLADNHTVSGEALDLNARGHVVGYGSNAQGTRHALLWKNGKVIDLGALEGPDGARNTPSRANAINASGMVVGQSESTRSRPGAVQWIDGRGSIVDLGAVAYGTYSDATAVNGHGVVVGVSSVGDGVAHRPIAWINGAAFDLKAPAGTDGSTATGINDAGTVVGAIEIGSRGALVWPHYDDEPIDLNILLDADGCHDGNGNVYRLTYAGAINNRGEILAGSFNFPHLESFRLVPVTSR